MNLLDIIEEVEKEYLYHATYMPLLPSIKKEGLNPKISKKSWDISGNYVYLSPDRDAAESYAETSDKVPDSYLDEIVVLKVDKNLLDKHKLTVDTNNHSGDTYQYADVIPWKHLKEA